MKEVPFLKSVMDYQYAEVLQASSLLQEFCKTYSFWIYHQAFGT